ncbi:MAG: hypothetical protein IJJ69_12425 [Oscillospiraceae bacterium]|nr:hypothetical protein [Oscillospiraceae bacterium]
MKKTRIFAGLTALLLCFQAGISMTAFAGDTGILNDGSDVTASDENQLQNICDQIQQFIEERHYPEIINCYAQVCSGIGDGWYYGLTNDFIRVTSNSIPVLNEIMAYCEEQGFTEQCDIVTDTLESGGVELTIKAGDVNLDESLDILDVVTLNKAILRKENLNALQNIAADANKDGTVDSSDSLAIMKAIVGLIEKASDKQLSSGVQYLSKSVKADAVEVKTADDAFITAQTGFYLNIFQKAEQETPDENILVSPYSVMQALAMTANGADGQTRSEMEQTLGGIPLDELNQYLYTQRTNQPNTEKCKLSTANSIWYRNDENRMNILPDFLKVNADYYSADAFKAPFDNSTITDINNWVSNKTDRMINQLLDPTVPIPDDAMLYLINAVSFDAKWSRPYTTEYTHERDFTAWDGTVQKANMMSSEEFYYLEDAQATGFYKSYSGGRYAFAALLPNEDITVDEYISGMTADSLHETLSNPTQIKTYAGLPKFSYDYDIKLNDTLISMGMEEAFNPLSADFTKMAVMNYPDENLFISKVQHITHIDVTEEGTRAAAVTAVMMEAGEALIEDYRTVTLDRPFVYMIVDMDTHLPVFMGAVKSID